MEAHQSNLTEKVFKCKMGRYDIVRTALDWIEVNRYNEDYRKLEQAELINKALTDVVDNIATPEKIEELRKKMKKDEKSAASASLQNAPEAEKAGIK
ncbi:MAG: hypothetical protein LBO62_02325 [Endomicrobium sp.]|jgi:hypothetical protein|nr:hypothetical protein [Endomicrobium sp.]